MDKDLKLINNVWIKKANYMYECPQCGMTTTESHIGRVKCMRCGHPYNDEVLEVLKK